MFKLVLSGILLLIFTGCSSSKIETTWQHKINNSLNSINVLELNEFLSQSKLLQVNFSVKNESNITKEFRYKIVWFDKLKQPIDTILSNWKNVTLAGNDNVYLTVIAPNESVVDYKILIN
jgi:uncharacterized protein YcfL